MFNCREISKLVSESMDRELYWWQKTGIHFHLLMCKYCASFSKQLHELQNFVKLQQGQIRQHKMDEQVKKRIKKRLASKKSSK